MWHFWARSGPYQLQQNGNYKWRTIKRGVEKQNKKNINVNELRGGKKTPPYRTDQFYSSEPLVRLRL